ncbi:hypothetical protein SEUCBS139899_008325 [Sporothrix eucalyptigena]|uniref:Ubiquinol-cytochrome c chaperone domain-containing protein n=1 Tax=Sporothrix eucalyptigena TaxID=1812306 RepID=A0ABP0CY35_9PEZI
MVRPSCRPCSGAALARCARPATLTGASTTRQTRALHQAVWAHQTRESQEQTQKSQKTPQTTRSRRDFHTTPGNAGIAQRLGGMARQAIMKTAEPYGAFGVTRNLYKKCTQPAAYEISEETRRNDKVPTTEDGEELGKGGGLWHEEFNLLPSFSTWSQVTMLHMYLLITRLRCFDKETYQLWQSMMSDHFFQEAEDKMDRLHHISSRGLRQRHLQDLFMAWRGVIVAYDEGLMRGDAVLAAAVWRNLFKANPDTDLRHLAAIVAWMRRSLAQFERTPDEAFVLHAGATVFSWPPPTFDLRAVDEPATKELALLLQQAERKEADAVSAPETSEKAAAA